MNRTEQSMFANRNSGMSNIQQNYNYEDANISADETSSNASSNIESFQSLVNLIFSVIVYMKSYHWRTRIYSRHQASGAFVDEMESLLDLFVESYSGRMGSVIDDVNIDFLGTSNDKKSVDILKALSNGLTSSDIIDPSWVDIIVVRDDMVKLINKTLYLFDRQ